jgi:ribonuclease inhibitor
MSHGTPELLKIDVGTVNTPQDLHRLLADALHFPGYYGRNWDAFDECIRVVELPPRIEIVGLDELRAHLPREAELLQRCVADFSEESAHDITIRKA